MDEVLDSLMPVGRWPTVAQAYEHALVVLAMNRDCRVRPADGEFVLEVEPDDAELVSRELDLYLTEQQERVNPSEAPVFSLGMDVAVLWAVLLTVIYWYQVANPRFEDGFMNSSAGVFVDHEWWRPLTALFLHGSGEHLLGNLAVGGFFCIMVASAFGAWRGWALILLSGFLGNLVNAWVHLPGPFFSLGASTATFGALGLVVGHGLIQVWWTHRFRVMKPVLVPLGVGLGLFGWWGIGGGDTDVSAHLFGAAFGMILGAVAAAFIRPEPTNRR